MNDQIGSAVIWALAIANDNSHGYDQAHRWGIDYDCSSLVISAFEHAGVPVKSKGAILPAIWSKFSRPAALRT